MSSKIPSIDFEHFLAGSSKGRQDTASEIDSALRGIGCFFLRGHGIQQSRIDTYFDWSREFFALSKPNKELLTPPPYSLKRGYNGLEKEKVRGQIALKEDFSFSNPHDDSKGCWPIEEQLPGFREFAARIHEDCAELMGKLLECLTMSLHLRPEEALNQSHSGSMFVSSLIHYPALSAQDLRSDQLIRNPAHSDFNTLTLLFQHQIGGLEVADMSSTDKRVTVNVEKTAKFIPVEPNNEILVLPGYTLRRWTNNIYPGAVHRVSAPVASVDGDEQEMTTERYSFAYFALPDEDTTIEAFSTCYSDERPKKWAPLQAGEWLRKKRLEAHS